jgi:predicted metal-dependent hydrolase
VWIRKNDAGLRNNGDMPYSRRDNHEKPSLRNRGNMRNIVEQTVDIAGMTVRIHRKPIKNMYLRIKPPNAEIVVSAPEKIPESTIVRFVVERREWIERMQRGMLQARDRQVAQLGESSGENGIGGNAEDGSVWTVELKGKACRNIESALPAMLAKWEPIIGRKPTKITLRTMTSRWGSCTPRTGRVRLNLQLGLMDPKFLEYVLVHEMTHLRENGHGERFQRRMNAYLPQWRQLRKEINRHVVMTTQ